MNRLKFLFIISIYLTFQLNADSNPVSYTKLLFGGDVMFNWGINETKQKYGRNSPLIGLKNLFMEADFRAINLETCITKNSLPDFEKPYVFNSTEEDLLSLRDIGVDLVFLGNNHTLDYSEKGLLETMENLTDMNLKYVGAGKNIQEANHPFEAEISGNQFQFYSISEIGEKRLFAKEKKAGIASFHSDFSSKLESKKASKIYSIHWGEEYRPTPYTSQIQKAHSLIDKGVKVVIGHHPHIPQAIEKYKNGIIFYSLGNLIFGSRNTYLNHNIVPILHFQNGELTLCEIVPVFGKFQKSEHFVKPLEGEEATTFLQELSILCKKRNTKLEIKNGRGYIHFRKE